MKYIHIDGQVIPKHCIYGPRQAEGIILSDYEWWRVTDHLVREQREKDISAALKAKEEAKIAVSHDMTRDWTNTLASIKTQGNQKRQEMKEKEKQDKVDKYNAILKDREQENKKKCEQIRKIVFEEMDEPKTVNMAVLYSLVLDERNRQIERKNLKKAAEAKKDQETVLRARKEAEDYRRELQEERILEWKKKMKQKELLDKQMEDKRRRKQKDIEEFEASKQDIIKKRIEDEKIENCLKLNKIHQKKFAEKYMGKTQRQLELQKKMALELEVEDEINQINSFYDRVIKRERMCREQKLRKEETERRRKISDFIGEKLLEASKKEEAILTAAIEQHELRLKREEEENKQKRMQLRLDRMEEKKNAEKRLASQRREKEEERKWAMIQQYRSAEVNEEQRQAEMKRMREVQEGVKKSLDCQMKQLAERKEQELKEKMTPLEDQVREAEDLKLHCQEALDFAKELHLPDYPIRAAIAKVKRIKNIVDKNEELQQKKEEEGNCRQQKLRTMASGCYCLKY